MELTSREKDLIRLKDAENKENLQALQKFKEKHFEYLFNVLDRIRLINNDFDSTHLYKKISTKEIEEYISTLNQLEKTLIKQTNCKHTNVQWESDGYFNCTEDYRLTCTDCQLIFAYK